jgi:hypothetical protein
MSSIYQINKGVSKPIVFKGLKAQYIAYLDHWLSVFACWLRRIIYLWAIAMDYPSNRFRIGHHFIFNRISVK